MIFSILTFQETYRFGYYGHMAVMSKMESSPRFQNHIKYFFQRKKGKKLTEHIFPLEKNAFTP